MAYGWMRRRGSGSRERIYRHPQNGATPSCHSLQIYGGSNSNIHDNYFHGVEDCIYGSRCTDNETITNNVCVTSQTNMVFYLEQTRIQSSAITRSARPAAEAASGSTAATQVRPAMEPFHEYLCQRRTFTSTGERRLQPGHERRRLILTARQLCGGANPTTSPATRSPLPPGHLPLLTGPIWV